MITEMDKKNHIFKVIDSGDKDAEPITVEVKDYIPKVVITVGYAGYLLLATESIEGLIILGLAVLFLVILYIVAELLKKEPQDDYDETDTEPGYVKSKKELKSCLLYTSAAGEEITLSANGEDEEAAMAGIEQYLSNQ